MQTIGAIDDTMEALSLATLDIVFNQTDRATCQWLEIFFYNNTGAGPTLPATTWGLSYAIKTQQKVRNAPSREL